MLAVTAAYGERHAKFLTGEVVPFQAPSRPQADGAHCPRRPSGGGPHAVGIGCFGSGGNRCDADALYANPSHGKCANGSCGRWNGLYRNLATRFKATSWTEIEIVYGRIGDLLWKGI
jgi:hypothetical protein